MRSKQATAAVATAADATTPSVMWAAVAARISLSVAADAGLRRQNPHALDEAWDAGAARDQEAAEHDAQDAPPLTGRAYCSLPLPILTGLPVHVNAAWALSRNRRHLWLQEEAEAARGEMLEAGAAKAKWNELLIGTVVPAAYARLLELIAARGPPPHSAAASAAAAHAADAAAMPYRFWPVDGLRQPWPAASSARGALANPGDRTTRTLRVQPAFLALASATLRLLVERRRPVFWDDPCGGTITPQAGPRGEEAARGAAQQGSGPEAPEAAWRSSQRVVTDDPSGAFTNHCASLRHVLSKSARLSVLRLPTALTAALEAAGRPLPVMSPASLAEHARRLQQKGVALTRAQADAALLFVLSAPMEAAALSGDSPATAQHERVSSPSDAPPGRDGDVDDAAAAREVAPGAAAQSGHGGRARGPGRARGRSDGAEASIDDAAGGGGGGRAAERRREMAQRMKLLRGLQLVPLVRGALGTFGSASGKQRGTVYFLVPEAWRHLGADSVRSGGRRIRRAEGGAKLANARGVTAAAASTGSTAMASVVERLLPGLTRLVAPESPSYRLLRQPEVRTHSNLSELTPLELLTPANGPAEASPAPRAPPGRPLALRSPVLRPSVVGCVCCLPPFFGVDTDGPSNTHNAVAQPTTPTTHRTKKHQQHITTIGTPRSHWTCCTGCWECFNWVLQVFLSRSRCTLPFCYTTPHYTIQYHLRV